jgi:hypothetical protein
MLTQKATLDAGGRGHIQSFLRRTYMHAEGADRLAHAVQPPTDAKCVGERRRCRRIAMKTDITTEEMSMLLMMVARNKSKTKKTRSLLALLV